MDLLQQRHRSLPSIISYRAVAGPWETNCCCKRRFIIRFLEAVRDHGLEMGDAPLRSTPVGYEMDLEALERQAADPKAKIMFLCSPHNPVGRVWNRQELTAVMEICLQTPGIGGGG